MQVRSSISQGVQIGVEPLGSEGIAVAADIALNAMGFSPVPNLEFENYGPMGNKYDTVAALIREWSTSAVEGRPTYTEIVYALSSLLCSPDIVDADPTFTWTWLPESRTQDDPITLTIERGDDNFAERMVGGVVNELAFAFSRTAAPTMNGQMFARNLVMGITKTADPEELALEPILPGHIDVFLDDTPEDIGTTQLEAVLAVTPRIGNRFSQLWVLDSRQDSYAAIVETKPDAPIELVMMADSAGLARLEEARASSTKFMRIEAESVTEIETGITYRFRMDYAVKISGGGQIGDRDGVYAVTWQAGVMHDPNWGRAHQYELRTSVASL
jgi:hypothetical protein